MRLTYAGVILSKTASQMEQRNEIRIEIMKNKISATIVYKTHYSTKIVISGLTKKRDGY
jgi:hypothetical protein